MDSLRRHTDYGNIPLDEARVPADPMHLFGEWLKAAESAEIFEPNAFVLGTIDPDDSPSTRTVLLKGLDEAGFEFVSTYTSHKGKAMDAHPQVSMLFPWYALKRQVIVYGTVVKTDDATSDAYWQRRPQGAQLAAIASQQSQPVDSRETLDARMEALESEYPEGTPVPRPATWGGYRILPSSIEFWQGRTSRFHDRLRYDLAADGLDMTWTLTRIQP